MQTKDLDAIAVVIIRNLSVSWDTLEEAAKRQSVDEAIALLKKLPARDGRRSQIRNLLYNVDDNSGSKS